MLTFGVECVIILLALKDSIIYFLIDYVRFRIKVSRMFIATYPPLIRRGYSL